MPCAIDSTVGGASSNSYASIAEADAYHESHLYAAAWDAAVADQKCRALVMATRLIESEAEKSGGWVGFATTVAQRLGWPRTWAVDAEGDEIPSDQIPQQLVEATAETARRLLTSDLTADDAIAAQGITRLRADVIELEFSGSKRRPLPEAALDMISLWFRNRSSGSVVELERA